MPATGANTDTNYAQITEVLCAHFKQLSDTTQSVFGDGDNDALLADYFRECVNVNRAMKKCTPTLSLFPTTCVKDKAMLNTVLDRVKIDWVKGIAKIEMVEPGIFAEDHKKTTYQNRVITAHPWFFYAKILKKFNFYFYNFKISQSCDKM